MQYEYLFVILKIRAKETNVFLVSGKEDNIINTLGKFVYSKRIQNKMTVLEFAENVGITPSFVSKIELDILTPSEIVLEEISYVLTLTEEEINNFYQLSKLKISKNLKIKNFILENIDENKKVVSLMRIPNGLDIDQTEWKRLLTDLKNLI